MSDLGWSPPAPNTVPDPMPPGGGSSSDVPTWVVLVAGVLALGLAGLLGFVILAQSGSKPNASAPPSAPSYPAKWDHRIAPYAKIAAKLRGLHFDHPVPVRFLSPAKFEKSLTSDRKLTQADRVEIEHQTGLLRAFGLISGDVNLVQAIKGFTGGATLAYYSFADKSITVRGHTVTPSVRATLVHELTHVLQDQHFGVGARLKALGKQARHGPSSSAGSVLDAIVEGDAQRVEHLYRDSLTVQQRAALDSGQQGEAAQARKRLAQIPKIVITEMSSPYTLGEGLVQTVAANGGNAAVNRLLRKPPTHESALLDPFRLVLGGTKATQVAVPKLARGEKSFAKGEMGVLTWYFMLAERLPLAAALAAADGWGGDAFVGFERNGSTCALMDFAGQTPTDTTRMVSALQQWVAAVPGTPASVSRVGGAVRFDSCDPGTSVPAAQDDSEAAVNLLTDRTSIALAVVRSGAPKATARCLAGRMVQAYSLPQLSDPNFGKNDPTIQAQVQQFAADCH